ncbi:MAG: SBBP repeat-containing protein, partial [Actinomycetota bacterium]
MIGKGTARRGNWLLIGGLAAAGITAWSAVDHAPRSVRGTSGHGDVRSAYARLPLAFEPNLGQAGDDVRYLARVPGATLLIGDGQATLRLRPSDGRASRAGAQAAGRKRQARRIEASGVRGTGAAVTMRFVGARAKTAPRAERRLPGRVNYLIGQDRTRWTTNIPTFAEVRSTGIYDGVDVAYYGNGRQLEYDLIVKPGADPSVIKVALTGADQLSIDPAGDLLMETAAGVVRQDRPVAYQEVDGTRRPVGVRYALNERVLGFVVEEYDRSRPLLIDPLINYGSYLGGSGDDLGASVGVDAAGNAYVTGSTESANFPTLSALDTTLTGTRDVFVSKLNAAGTALLYSTYVGGDGVDSAQGLAVSSTGTVTVTGDTTSANFPTPGGVQTTYGGAGDAFIFRLDESGGGVFSTYLGGSDSDLGNGVAVDGDGNIYVAGTTGSANLPGAVNAFGGFSDAFVTKLNAAGSAIVYSRFVGGGDFDAGFGIAVDDVSDEAVVVGDTFSTNFPLQGALQNAIRGVGGSDAFVSRLNAAGSALAFSTYFGGNDFDSARAVAVDGAGAVYFTGTTYSDSNTNAATPDTPAGEHFPIGSAFQSQL